MEDNFLTLLLIGAGVILVLMLLGAFKQNDGVKNGFRRRRQQMGGGCSGYACSSVWSKASGANTCCQNCDNKCTDSDSCKEGCNCMYGASTCPTGKNSSCVDLVVGNTDWEDCQDTCEYNSNPNNMSCAWYEANDPSNPNYTSIPAPCDLYLDCTVSKRDLSDCKSQCCNTYGDC